jgi:integrating conjugative element protein (TIGR03756 family)
MLYPASWVPGLAETSDGFPQTWGGIYPRNNDLHQVQGVKASAVLANRVLSIVSQSSQPHIYTKLEGDYSGFRMFETGGSPVWQRLYPNAEPRCGTFGANDSLWLTSWGDGNTSSGEGYVWNVWRRYECCQKAGQIFLSSVHW